MRKHHFVSVFFAAIFGSHATPIFANSCSNVTIHGSFDQSGINEDGFGIYAAGTFRIEGEPDENKQPLFNLTSVDCDKQNGETVTACKVISAAVWADGDKPNPDSSNCSLDLEITDFSMKEISAGVLVGSGGDNTGCYNTMLTIDKNTKKVYRSFTRTKYADNYDKIKSGTCGLAAKTHVLMNCTPYPRLRKNGQTPPRYCDFSSSSDK